MTDRYLILVASYQSQNLAVLFGIGFGLLAMFAWWMLSRLPWPRVRSWSQALFVVYLIFAVYAPLFTLL